MSRCSQTPVNTRTDLSIITGDKRLQRLFGSHDKACAVELWVLQLKRDAALETRLLYGRVSPFDFSNSSWSAPTEDRFKLIRDGLSVQCVRLTAYCASTSVLDVLSSLVGGASLVDASKAGSISMGSAFEKRFGSMTMRSPLSVRPVMHLPPRDYFRFSTNRVSPLDDCSADSAAITSLVKSELFVIAGEEDRELARFAVDTLSADTGLEFSDLDAWRLGDVELLVLPGKTETGASLVHIQGEPACLKVEVEQPLAARPSCFRVSARFLNDGAVFHYGTAVIPEGAPYPASVTLAIPPGMEQIRDAYVLEIEAQEADTGESWLCFQWGAFLVREIGQFMHFSGGQASVKSDWLAKALRPAHAKRLEEAQQIARHTRGTESVIGGRKADPWVTANRHVRSTVKGLLPPQSSGRFFLRYSEGENTGRLELAEWIKKLLAEHRDKHIAWFDPYMEDMGIHLLNQYGSDTGNYILFTGTGRGDAAPWWEHVYAWMKSEEAPEDRVDSRILKLQAACRLWSTRYGTVRLRVFGLPQADLHDRMVLIRDAQMRPVAGYHLSNSLQHANENYPLLITPIPLDVLQLVVDYSDDLLRGSMKPADGQGNSEPRLKCLFDSENEQHKSVPRYVPTDIFSTPRLGEVLDWWLSSSGLTGADADALKLALDVRGLLRDGQFRDEVFQELPSKTWAEGLELPNFDSAWDALGSLLSSTMAGDNIREAPDQPVLALREALLKYLDSDRSDAIQPPERRGVVDMSEQLRRTLGDLMKQAADPQQLFHHDVTEVAWGDFYAFKVLWATEPADLVAWIDQGAEVRFQSNRRRQLGLKCAVRLISFETEWACTSRQLEALLKCKNDLLRWIGYVAFETVVHEDPKALAPTGATSVLSAAERLHLLGWLTARATRRSTLVRDALIKELLASMPAKLGDSELRLIIDSMRNVLGNVYDSPSWILQDILWPLLQTGLLDIDAVAGLWFEELAKTWEECVKTGSIFFRGETEGRFTDEVAGLCALASSDLRNSVRKRVEKVLRNQICVVQRPFSAMVDWGTYDRSFRLMLWISGFLWAWMEHLPRPSQTEAILRDAEVGLERRSESEWRRSSAEELLRYRASHL